MANSSSRFIGGASDQLCANGIDHERFVGFVLGCIDIGKGSGVDDKLTIDSGESVAQGNETRR